MIRDDLLAKGTARVLSWCTQNKMEAPGLRLIDSTIGGFCAYYRPTTTRICLHACALPGYAGRAWSWPGYVIDRTPYGVVAHELGHHVDWMRSDQRGAYFGDFSRKIRQASKEVKLTNYCPNDAEWFAEMFRLFVTNSDLLRRLRPNTYAEFCERGLDPIYPAKNWRTELAGAPQRTILQAEKKIVQASA